MQDKTDRRFFLAAALTAGAALPTAALAGNKRGGAYAVPASREKVCATCTYWGATRRVSGDRSEVHVKSLGYCNNQESPNYRKMTSPDSGPMAAWVKWPALD
jgi:hypothetical protein